MAHVTDDPFTSELEEFERERDRQLANGEVGDEQQAVDEAASRQPPPDPNEAIDVIGLFDDI
jgi:hypothetical protein